MRSRPLILAVAVAAILVAAAVAMQDDGASWSISYDTGGGELPDDASTSYREGDRTFLPIPERDGYTFAGWFLDEGFTGPVVVLGEGVGGDVTVHACWEDGDLTGRGFEWIVSGSYLNGTIEHRVSGMVTTEWIAQRDGSLYFETEYDVEYVWDGGFTTDDRRVTGWTADRGYDYIGTETVDGYPCTVWDDGDGTRVWLYHLMVEVRAVSETDGGSIVQELHRMYGFVPETGFVPDVRADYPLTISGVHAMEVGDRLTLTADGDGFLCWLIDGEPAGYGRELTIDRADPGLRIEAVTEQPYIVADPGSRLEDFGLGEDARITDDAGSDVGRDIGDLAPGHYTAEGDAGGYTRVLEFFLDEVRILEHSWIHAGKVRSVSLEIRYSDVYMMSYQHTMMGGYRGSMDDAEYIRGYHTPDDPTISELLDSLKEAGPGLDGFGFASLVLSFVQTLPYVSDQDAFGTEDYWLYPLETLWLGGGDCEDKTILCDTIMKAAGYDVAFVLFTDHAMSAVALDCPGFSVTVDGDRFVFCETTSDRFGVGDAAASHLPSDVFFICRV